MKRVLTIMLIACVMMFSGCKKADNKAAESVKSEAKKKEEKKKEEKSGSNTGYLVLTLVISLVIAIGVFMLLPAFVANFLYKLTSNHLLVNTAEGILADEVVQDAIQKVLDQVNSMTDEPISVDPEALRGRVCYGGLDLSSTKDITAFVLVFPPS